MARCGTVLAVCVVLVSLCGALAWNSPGVQRTLDLHMCSPGVQRPNGFWCTNMGICVSPHLCSASQRFERIGQDLAAMAAITRTVSPDLALRSYSSSITQVINALLTSELKQHVNSLDVALRFIRAGNDDVHTAWQAASDAVVQAVGSVASGARKSGVLFQQLQQVLATDPNGASQMSRAVNLVLDSLRTADEELSTAGYKTSALISSVAEMRRRISEGEKSAADLVKQLVKVHQRAKESEQSVRDRSAMVTLSRAVFGCMAGLLMGPAGCVTWASVGWMSGEAKQQYELEEREVAIYHTTIDLPAAEIQDFLITLDGQYKNASDSISAARGQLAVMRKDVLVLLKSTGDSIMDRYALGQLSSDADALGQRAYDFSRTWLAPISDRQIGY